MNKFEETYVVHSMAIKGNDRLEHGGKILLPPQALDHLSRLNIQWPIFFQLSSLKDTRKSTHCGVHEFTAEPGVVYMPYWMMQQLGLSEGDRCIVKQKALKPGTYVKIQAHSKKFLDVANPRAVLEKHLRNFSTMSVGDVFQFRYNNKIFAFNVLELKPANAVSIVETDINVDFAPPVDYVEPEPNVTRANKGKQEEESSHPTADDVYVVPEPKPSEFPGSGSRVDGKTKSSRRTQRAPPPKTRLTLGTSVAVFTEIDFAKPPGASAVGSTMDYWSTLDGNQGQVLKKKRQKKKK